MKTSTAIRANWKILLTIVWIAAASSLLTGWYRLASTARYTQFAPSLILAQTHTPPAQDRGAAVQQFWQVGIIADESANDTSAMRTTIRTFVPPAVADTTTDYYWIGSYLADNTFIQVGYAIPWYDGQPRWFYCMFDAHGKKGPCEMGPPGSGGDPGSWHRYTMAAHPAASGGWDWTFQMDEDRIGTIQLPTGSTGQHAPAVFAEQSAFAPKPSLNTLGPVEFMPALEIQHGAAYYTPRHARAIYSGSETCPPYGIGVTGLNDIWLGDQLGCLATGSVVW